VDENAVKHNWWIIMKKRITIVLEVETEDPVMMTDDFIKNDLECEINCASNAYEIITIETTEVT